jgi:hypothetical protein
MLMSLTLKGRNHSTGRYNLCDNFYVKWAQKFKMRSNGVSVSEVGIINGCNSAHEQGLRILIVGAGIGGLTAAIALRKQGHRVLVMSGPK